MKYSNLSKRLGRVMNTTLVLNKLLNNQRYILKHQSQPETFRDKSLSDLVD